MFASKYSFVKKKKNSIDSVNKKVKQQIGALNPSFRLPVPPLMLYRFMEFDILCIYDTPQKFVDLSSETLTKVCILASYF